MAHITEVLVMEVSNGAASASDWVRLDGAPPGYRPFGSVCADNDTIHYMIRAVDVVGRPQGPWECGRGTIHLEGSQWWLIRQLVTAGTNGTSPVAFAEGLKHVSIANLASPNEAIRYDLQAAMGLDMVGQVAYFAMTTPPPGWIKANGAAISRAAFARLFARVGTLGGAGDGSTTFNVPDMRGVFPRGLDDGRGLDTNRTLGTYQASANLSHAHSLHDPGHNHGFHDPGHNHHVNDPGHAHSAWTDSQGSHSHRYVRTGFGASGFGALNVGISEYETDTGWAGAHGHNVGIGGAGTGIWLNASGTGAWLTASATGMAVHADGANEARPQNVALLACIKY